MSALRRAIALGLCGLAAGCRAPVAAAPSTDGDGVRAGRARHVITAGAAPPLAVAVNGCDSKAFSLPFAALKEHPLSAESFRDVMALATPLCSPVVQGNLLHLVQCALPEGDALSLTTLDGQALHFSGQLGLAPDWRTKPCDQACQEWVSACMYALRNYYPVHVEVWLSAETIPVVPGEEDFPIQEGAFFGNYFQGYRTGYACRGSSYDPMAAVWRRCAQPGSDCGDILAIGPCSADDGLRGERVASFACEHTNPDGSYRDCHTRLSNPDGTFPADSVLFPHAITINLRRPDFNAACP